MYPPGNWTIAEVLSSDVKGSTSKVAPDAVALATVSLRLATS